MKQMTRQQLAGWMLAIMPAAGLVSSLFNLAVIIQQAAAGLPWIGELAGVVVSDGFAIGILFLSIGLIKNDGNCRLALMIYSAMFFAVGIAVPIICLPKPPELRGLVIFSHTIENPGDICYALFFLIFFVLFGIPLWLLARRPGALLFGGAPRAKETDV